MTDTEATPIFEDMLAPGEDGPVWRRDVAVLAPLILLAVVLLPGWAGRDYVLRLLLSPAMLTALAMLTAMRLGVVDLSVWVVADLSAVITTWLLLHGVTPAIAMAIALSAGAAVGAINALLTVRLRIASPASTLVVAILIVLSLRWTIASELSLPQTVQGGPVSPYDASIMLAAMVYALVLAAMTMTSIVRPHAGVGRGWALLAVTCASGVIASAGGVCRLIDTSRATVPFLPVGELRVAAAAVLAGAAILAGKRRGAMSALCLLPALLVATVWLLETTPWWVGGYYLHVGGLLVLAIGSQVLLKRALDRPTRLARACAAMALAGMVLIALTARFDTPFVEIVLTVVGWTAFIAATVMAVLQPSRQS